jgi:hypothetical protein
MVRGRLRHPASSPLFSEPPIRFETDPGRQMKCDFATIRRGRDRLSVFIALIVSLLQSSPGQGLPTAASMRATSPGSSGPRSAAARHSRSSTRFLTPRITVATPGMESA